VDPVIDLVVTVPGCPLEIVGSIDGRPVWYRARGPRWELYEARIEDLDAGSIDPQTRRIAGTNIQFIAEGLCEGDQDTDLLFALARIGSATRVWTSWAQWWATSGGIRLRPEDSWNAAFKRYAECRSPGG
jgi:hypothetical protein